MHLAIAPCTDAEVLAAVQHATITVAYREYFPDTPPPTVAELAAIWNRRLADPTAVAMVAWRDAQSVGSVLARQDPDFPEGQIAGLYVLPAEWGQVTGSALHDAALAVLSEAGYHAAGLWVIAANDRARRMYERRGWVCCPGVEQDAYGVSEVRYRRGASLRRDSGSARWCTGVPTARSTGRIRRGAARRSSGGVV